MVTVPPCLCGPSEPPAAASSAGLEAFAFGFDPLLHAVRTVLSAIRAIRALLRLMLAVPSFIAIGGSGLLGEVLRPGCRRAARGRLRHPVPERRSAAPRRGTRRGRAPAGTGRPRRAPPATGDR